MAADCLLLRAVRGEPTAHRPVWIMRQAGRYLPEYRELRARHSFQELSLDARLAAQVTLLPMQRFALDAAIIFADIMSPLRALGVAFDFDPGPVVERPIRDLAGVKALARPAAGQLAPEVQQALDLVRGQLPPDTALLGFCGAPWTLAAYLVEGRGVKDFPALRSLAASEPEVLDLLLGRLADAMRDYLVAQHAAGADAVQVFDSWAGLLSLRDWQRQVRPHLLRLLEGLGEAGVPRILFLQNAPHLVDAYARLPAEVLAVDWRADISGLQARYPDRALQGNLDPAVLLGGAETTRRAAVEMLSRVSSARHVVNLGHGILPQTPLASVAALVDAVRAERTS